MTPKTASSTTASDFLLRAASSLRFCRIRSFPAEEDALGANGGHVRFGIHGMRSVGQAFFLLEWRLEESLRLVETPHKPVRAPEFACDVETSAEDTA